MKKMTKGEKTSLQIYRSALELFREKGYDNVSVEEIVQKAGTAKGTFYIYYSSKAQIITRMLREYDDHYTAVAAELDPSAPVTERLESIVRSSCRFTQEAIGVDLIRVLYTNQIVPGQTEQDALNGNRTLYRLLRDLMSEGQASGAFRRELSAAEMTEWLIRCIRGTFYEWCMCGGTFDLSEECIRFTRTFCRGLEA